MTPELKEFLIESRIITKLLETLANVIDLKQSFIFSALTLAIINLIKINYNDTRFIQEFKENYGYECLTTMFGVCPSDAGVEAFDLLLNIGQLDQNTECPESPLQSTFNISVIDPDYPTITNMDAVAAIKHIYKNTERYTLPKSRITYDPLHIISMETYNEYKTKLMEMLFNRLQKQPNNIFIQGVDLLFFVQSFPSEPEKMRCLIIEMILFTIKDVQFFPAKTLSFILTILQDPTVDITYQRELAALILELSKSVEAKKILRDIGVLYSMINDFNNKTQAFLDLKFEILNSMIELDENIDIFINKALLINFKIYLNTGLTRDVAFELFQVLLSSLIF